VVALPIAARSNVVIAHIPESRRSAPRFIVDGYLRLQRRIRNAAREWRSRSSEPGWTWPNVGREVNVRNHGEEVEAVPPSPSGFIR
jgi:hypothetical protein